MWSPFTWNQSFLDLKANFLILSQGIYSSPFSCFWHRSNFSLLGCLTETIPMQFFCPKLHEVIGRYGLAPPGDDLQDDQFGLLNICVKCHKDWRRFDHTVWGKLFNSSQLLTRGSSIKQEEECLTVKTTKVTCVIYKTDSSTNKCYTGEWSFLPNIHNWNISIWHILCIWVCIGVHLHTYLHIYIRANA